MDLHSTVDVSLNSWNTPDLYTSTPHLYNLFIKVQFVYTLLSKIIFLRELYK